MQVSKREQYVIYFTSESGMPRKPKSVRQSPWLYDQTYDRRELFRRGASVLNNSVSKLRGRKRKAKANHFDRMAKTLGKVLVINTGGTSTKLGIYLGKDVISETNLKYSPAARFKKVIDELPSRLEQVKRFFNQLGFTVEDSACVMARGGLLAPIPAGIYRINERMCADLRMARYGEHSSNLSALIAYELVRGTQVPALIADPVTVDEFTPLARISGYPGIERLSRQHTLNVRAVSRASAKKLGFSLNNLNAVCAHLGSGFSILTVKNGKLIDNADGLLGEGPFSIERAGTLPLKAVLELAYKYEDRKELEYRLSKKSGIVGYLGTTDFEEVEERIDKGDKDARLIFDAMVYQIAKNICAYSAPLKGTQMVLIITGGLANSRRLVSEIKKYVSWAFPKVFVYPGENEMHALRDSAYSALLGEEKIRDYLGQSASREK